MYEFDKHKNIDIRKIKWGYPPAPLLPKSLRSAWAEDFLPMWVCSETGLSKGSTLADLGSNVWNYMDVMSPRLKHFLVFLVRLRSNSIKHLRCVDRTWQVGLRLDEISWDVRMKKRLSIAGFIADERKLIELTFGDLLSMEGIGTLSILDYSATLEGVMDYYEKLISDYLTEKSNSKSSNLLTVFENIVNQEWSEQISKKDPRFAPLYPFRLGTLHERIDKMLSEPDSVLNAPDIPLLLLSIEKIKEKIKELEQCSLENCLLDFLRLISRAEGKRLEVLAQRFGWDGNEPSTLEQCGKQLGVTRERIRQIQKSIIKRIPKHPVFMPMLDQALALLEQLAPITMQDAASKLREKGIVAKDFHPYGVLEAAQLFGRETSLKVCEIRGQEMIVNSLQGKEFPLISKIARKLAGQSGVSNAFQVLDMVNVKGLEVDETQVRRVLRSINNFDFIDEDWFWVTDIINTRNRLYNISRRILSVASPQSVVSIRDGLRRYYKWRLSTGNVSLKTLTVPPLAILKEFYERHRSFRIEEDLVYCNDILDYKKELGEVECISVEVLRSTPSGLLDRKSFAEACMARGVNEGTFTVHTSYSPIIEHVDHDIWKLRGVKVDPADVEAVRIANHLRPREKRVQQYGWGEDRKLWIAARVPKLAGNMVIGCPGPFKRFLAGHEFTCISKHDKKDCGTIAITDNGASYGYSIFIRSYGIDENDVLLAEFNLINQTVDLSIAEDELLEEKSL